MRKELRKLIKALEDQGFDITVTTKQHYMVWLDGEFVTTLPGTPSDWRSLKNSIAAARRFGFRWPP
jgi:hypothetical protein